MSTRSSPVSAPPDSPSRRPDRHARDVAPRVAGLTVRFTLRSPALRWAAAVIVAFGGRCTLVARVEPALPPTSGSPTHVRYTDGGTVARLVMPAALTDGETTHAL